ncbi:hypothetical protein H5410_013350 [Solanum commersonii]|uniref:SKP1 component POZ domain-containing protein n=1 Tax=Solanum commersonii TaxID=4109 RepID=A0A9J6AUM8_SOLCO|nr:hypothetical protein H5410_013350 [Solanum commersonii]
MSSEKFITLKTSDGDEFKPDETVAVWSEVIKNIVQDQDCASNIIPLSNVDGKTMTKVHSSVLIDVLLAAKNLDDNDLRDVMSQEVVDRITWKTPKEIREEFEKFVTPKTSDGEKFKPNEIVVVRSEVIKNIAQDKDCASNVNPLSNVDGKIMTKVIEFWKKYLEKGVSDDQLKNFDKDFLKVTPLITGKTPEEIREEFGIMNDYTLEKEKKFITLKTSDGEEFKLDETIVVRSEVIKNIVQDQDCATNVIPLSNIDGKIMTKVIEYWKKHSEKGVSEDQLKNFDKDFLKVHSSVLIDVLLAAKNLHDNDLRDVMSQEVVDRITWKTPKEIREEFGILYPIFDFFYFCHLYLTLFLSEEMLFNFD